MRIYIADVYRLGIEFTREATRYYSRSTSKRILEALTRPPSLGIDTKISAIIAAVTEIEKERATLDSQRLFEVQRIADDIREC